MLFCCLAIFSACEQEVNKGFDPDDYEPILPPEPVYTLQTYASGENVTLLDDGLSNAIFRWIPSEKIGNMVVRYEVLFDSIQGDFSNPVYIARADNNGVSDYLTLSHSQLNNIARLAKIKANSKGILNWKVRVYCGLDEVTSAIVGSFSVLRLDGFDLIPETLYITGAATEGGVDLTQAPEFRDLGTADFEIFTKLEAGKDFYFVSSRKVDSITNYYYNGKKLVENDGVVTVSKNGVYRIKINYEAATYNIEEVTSVYGYYNVSGVHYPLNYVSNGLWKTDVFYPRLTGVSWAGSGEKRYQMRMQLSGATGSSTIIWGHKDSDRQVVPNESTDPSYFNMYTSPSSDDWAYSFRLPSQLNFPSTTDGQTVMSPVPSVIEAYFNSTYDQYRHVWKYNQ